MTSWYRALPNPERYRSSTKEVALDAEHSITAVIACYRDAEAIPVMYRRLTETFAQLGIDYEIIFVNDASPDDSEQVIREISERDRRVLGISHSRNFGSQAAFRSGMELATKNAVVLLDGDLQDPPELIAEFVERWKEGYDVVYGRRVSRETTWFMQRAYRAFYWAFDRFSYLSIPRDAGDFSLMDRRVVHAMLQCDERDLFLRGVRAFVGFRQTGVDYVRPKRMFGVTTNNLRRNIGWAKKGIFSFSNVPLTMLSFAGTVLFLLSLVLAAAQGAARLLAPDSAPRGRRHRGHPRAALRLAQPVRDRARGRVPGARLRGGQAAAALRPHEHRARRRGAPRLALRRRALGLAALMIRPWRPRRSPTWSRGPARSAARRAGASSRRRASMRRRSTSTRSPRASSPSTCTTAWSSARPATPSMPVPCPSSATSARPTTRLPSTASRRRCSRAAPTPGSCARSLPRLPRAAAALDIGTGEGSFLEELLALGFERRARLRAVGGAARGGVRARPRADRARRLRCARARRSSGPYDLITCFMTIEHVPDPAQLCRDAHGLLAPGGALMLVCHDRRAPLNRLLGTRSPIMDIEHLQLLSQPSVRALLERTGFARRGAAAPITNRYPLHYWLKLAPLPRRVKRALVAGRPPRPAALARAPRCRSATSSRSASVSAERAPGARTGA